MLPGDLSPVLPLPKTSPGMTWMTQAESPQPTTNFSTVSCLASFPDLCLRWWGRVESALLCLPWSFMLMMASSSDSRDSSSTHSILAFHNAAMSCQTRRLGFPTNPILFQANSESALSRNKLVRMKRMPSSLTHTTYLPDRDHLMVLIEPSPECKIVSRPLLPPSPMAPSQPCAA